MGKELVKEHNLFVPRKTSFSDPWEGAYRPK
jgi:hypothetical protein